MSEKSMDGGVPLIPTTAILQNTGGIYTYSAMLLVMAVAEELQGRAAVDLRDVGIRKSILKPRLLDYLNYLHHQGKVVLSNPQPTGEMAQNGYNYNSSFLENEPCYHIDGNKVTWSLTWHSDNLLGKGYSDALNQSRYNTLVMRLTAKYWVESHTQYGGTSASGSFNGVNKLVIDLTSMMANNVKNYVDILVLAKHIQWVRDEVEVLYTLGQNTDPDYYLHCYEANMSGMLGNYTPAEKLIQLEQCGYQTGGIYLLFTRKSMRENNNFYGQISGVSPVKLVSIEGGKVVFEFVPAVKTDEELLEDYENVREDKRHYFTDLLHPTLYRRTETIPLHSMCVEGYMGTTESYILTHIDTNTKVSPLVTVYGEVVEQEMSEAEAIYWVLNQRGYGFDKQLYADTYNGGKRMLWDIYGA